MSICGRINQKKILDLKRLFGNQSPIHVDIGFGDGNALIQEAEKNPETNFIGIEVHRPGIGRCLMEIKKKQLSNILISSHDAQEVMKSQIKDDSLDRINLYFPDPWPKKKHHKRRIVQEDFLDLINSSLMPRGFFYCKTDWEDYAKHISKVFESVGGWNKNSITDLEISYQEIPSTSYERKALKEGRLLNNLIYKKFI